VNFYPFFRWRYGQEFEAELIALSGMNLGQKHEGKLVNSGRFKPSAKADFA
jgi:hypothetical protein